MPEESIGKRTTTINERQGVIPIDLAPGPRLSSDDRARNKLLAMIHTLAAAKTQPWSARLLGWQLHLLTPLEAAALNARFEAELERLGPPVE